MECVHHLTFLISDSVKLFPFSQILPHIVADMDLLRHDPLSQQE